MVASCFLSLGIQQLDLSDQVKVREVIHKKLGVGYKITGPEWHMRRKEILEKYKASPFAELFNPHGYGLEYKDSSIHIDFDFPIPNDFIFCGINRKSYDFIEFRSWNLKLYLTSKGVEIKDRVCEAFLDILMTKNHRLLKQPHKSYVFLH